MIGILTEKLSAARNFEKALGGMSGVYEGQAYRIATARGHLYRLAEPHHQVAESLSNRYKSWELSNLPWNEKDFDWRYEQAEDSKDVLERIQSVLSGCDEICIATDDDPTGEGELLAWEIFSQLGLSPEKWTRMYFVDETVKELQEAFMKRRPIESMEADPDYRKAFYRSRWDYLSMQFTRIATKCGDGSSVLRQGRLKSAMIMLVGDALKAYSAYKKVPFYQNRFRDENGVIYTNSEEPTFPVKTLVPKIYHSSEVVKDSTEKKTTVPPKLLDLASLSAILVTKGYKAQEIMDTYQLLYQDHYVSYPRTEDHYISPEQFHELLPLIDQIASVVGVDSNLLTHRQPRTTHVKVGGSHGANRPGQSVPTSLQELSGKYNDCAAAIYKLLASNYLATLAEDYEYEQEKGHIRDWPAFRGTANIPVRMGWKSVFNDIKEKDEDPETENHENTRGIGTMGEPFVYEGYPKKPPYPTMRWLMKNLEKHDVGTGATRTATYAEVTSEARKYPLMKDSKGKISLTQYGEMSYQLLPGTNIGSLEVTERLMEEMREIAASKKDPEICLQSIQKMVLQDLDIMKKNGETMRKAMNIESTEYYYGIWNKKEIRFKREWSGHHFTDEECERLCQGQSITVQARSLRTNKEFQASGKLAEQKYKGIPFIGFQADFEKYGNKNRK